MTVSVCVSRGVCQCVISVGRLHVGQWWLSGLRAGGLLGASHPPRHLKLENNQEHPGIPLGTCSQADPKYDCTCGCLCGRAVRDGSPDLISELRRPLHAARGLSHRPQYLLVVFA